MNVSKSERKIGRCSQWTSGRVREREKELIQKRERSRNSLRRIKRKRKSKVLFGYALRFSDGTFCVFLFLWFSRV